MLTFRSFLRLSRGALLVGSALSITACPSDGDDYDPSDFVCMPQICGAAGTTAAVEVCTKFSNDAATECEYRFGGQNYACDECSTSGCATASSTALAACRADGRGDASVPDAAVETSCGEAPTIPNVEPPTVTGTGEGAIAHYTCSTGYTKTGSDPVCGADMQWSATPSCDVIVCPTMSSAPNATNPMLVMNGIDPNSVDPSFGEVFSWTCNAGFTSGAWGTPSTIHYRCEAGGWVAYDSGTMGSYRALGCQSPQWTTATDTVVDNGTHLQWQRAVSATTYTSTAATPCAGLTLGGGGGWRLPTPTELVDLYVKTAGNPSLPAGTFTGVPSSGVLWTSLSVGGMAAGISFANGTAQASASPSWAAWCVRPAP